jgi:choline kinase
VLAGRFGFEDVTSLPWTEIDFPEDISRARDEVLPQIERGNN